MRFTRRSAALTTPSQIAPVLQTSQNWFAEQLLKTIGRRVIFAIIANNSGRSSTAKRPVLDDIVRAISAAW